MRYYVQVDFSDGRESIVMGPYYTEQVAKDIANMWYSRPGVSAVSVTHD